MQQLFTTSTGREKVDTRLRAGVVGCGVGASHAYAYSQHPAVDLVAVCDLNPAAFGPFYERSRLAPGTVREYADHRAMLAEERLDLVSVVTPDEHHAAPVVDASSAGVKGILCEKPIAGSLADADRMIEAVERNGTHLLVDHTRNFDPCYTAVHDAVRAGAIGELTRIVAHLGGRRAMLFRNSTHLLGSVCFYAGAEPVWVIAALDRGFEDYGVAYRGQGGRDPMLDPGASLIVGFANGARALVNASKGTPALGVELDLLGTHGRIVVGDRETRYWRAQGAEGVAEPQAVPWPQRLAAPDLGVRLLPAVDQLVDLVRGGPAGPGSEAGTSPARAARRVLEILLGALHSQAQGMLPVQLPLPR
jgi:predicted dehydrogenase